MNNYNIDFIIKKLSERANVIAIRTDTVYGLICNALDKEATEKIYRIKEREKKKPLSIFVKSVDEVKKYVDETNLSNKTLELMNKYWPGALTIVFRKKDDTFDHITANSDGIGIRIPNDRELQLILEKVSFPLAQTSCNISGEKEYRNALEINEHMGNLVDLIVDGGEITNSIPSTVVSVECGDIIVLRNGAIKIDV